MRVIRCDGSPGAVWELAAALQSVLAGGEAVAPLTIGAAPPPRDPGPGQVVVSTSGSTGQPKWVQLSAA
ncbi:MAG: AMP-dependent synthetase, partial [Pseudonocardia sp.]